MMMRGREGKVPPAADLLVCFPPRAHLSLMPKPICSPARPSDQPPKRRQRQCAKKATNRGRTSPQLWAKSKAHDWEAPEPTSPKVTCAGQIKVRPKPSSCRNWQSVMEEIERLHNHQKQRRRSAWIDALGLKKDAMQFLTCLRNIRFDFRCFGAFPTAGISSDEEEEEEEVGNDADEENDRDSRDVFSKWFMILQENQGKGVGSKTKMVRTCLADDSNSDDAPMRPPPNALLLMRCRSAPAKRDDECKQNVVVMDYGVELSRISSEIAKEAPLEGGIKDMLSRSRSWKR